MPVLYWMVSVLVEPVSSVKFKTEARKSCYELHHTKRAYPYLSVLNLNIGG